MSLPTINMQALNPGALIVPHKKSSLDKSTIFSIYPREIIERKATVIPMQFIIPPGTYDDPGRLVIEPGSWWKTIYSKTDDKDQIIEMPIGSEELSISIIEDWVKGLFAVNYGIAQPGLFRVDGVVSVKELKEKFPELLFNARARQMKWYEQLIRFADQLYARTNGNPQAIGDDMRLAAHELGQKTKPWLADYQSTAMINCSACGALRNPAFPICPNCKAVIDVEAATKAGLTFAK